MPCPTPAQNRALQSARFSDRRPRVSTLSEDPRQGEDLRAPPARAIAGQDPPARACTPACTPGAVEKACASKRTDDRSHHPDASARLERFPPHPGREQESAI